MYPVSPGLNLSFQWPVDNGKITSVFGESRADHFHDGVDMECAGRENIPPGGRRAGVSLGPLAVPPGRVSGRWKFRVLKHGGDLYTLYLHLQDGSSIGICVLAEGPCLVS